MKKQNQGFAPIALIIAIVGVLVVSGGVYFLKKDSNPKMIPNYQENVVVKNNMIDDSSAVNINNTKTVSSNINISTTKDEYNRYVDNKCKIASGCNGPIHCVNKNETSEINSICVSLPEYQCYKQDSARCEVQKSGECGWTETGTLNQCISSSRNNNNQNNTTSQDFDGPTVVLTQAQAQNIVTQQWSDCSSGDCSSVNVTFQPDRGEQYLITAVYVERDTSVSQTKHELLISYVNNNWVPSVVQPNPNIWRMCHRGNSDNTTGWTTGTCI